MEEKMKSKRVKMFICILIILVILCVAGYFILGYLNSNNTEEITEYTPQEEISDEQMRQTIVSLYFKNKDKNELLQEARLIDVKLLMENPYYELVNMLIKGPKNDSLEAVIPEGTKLNKVELKGDKVILDFSEEFINNHKGGVELEKLTVYSIVNTLTELNEVNSVQFLINGKDDAKFKDNKLSLKEPFLRLK